MPRLWLVMPAAGSGRRMGGATPKQYLPLVGRTVIEWSLTPFLARADIAGVAVVLAPTDTHFRGLPCARDPRVRMVTGGAQRSDSVACGLRALSAEETDWVLVHDAARPCVHAEDVQRLIDALCAESVGGLLAAPVTDTLKSAAVGSASTVHAITTLPRANLWRAFTPQMFRYGLLVRALTEAPPDVTDDSAAVERLGFAPRLVLGRTDNIKITVPEDLPFAEFILRQRNASP